MDPTGRQEPPRALRVAAGTDAALLSDADPPAPPPTPLAQRRARLVLALALVLLGAWTIHDFLPALAWAAVIAIATWPLYRRAARRWPPGKHNLLLPSLFTLAVALVFMVPLALAGIQVGREAHTVMRFVLDAKANGIQPPGWLGRLPVGASQAEAWWAANLASPGGYSQLVERLNHGSLSVYTRELGGQLAHRVVIFGFTLLTLFFLYRDGTHALADAQRAGQRAFGPHGERIARQMVASVHGTVDGLVLVGLGEGVLIGVVYWFAGVPHPTLYGAATGIAAMIPFGAVVLFGTAALFPLASGSVGAAVAVVVAGSVVVFVADHFVRPVLIGGATKLPFLWVLLGILGGVETWGLLGLFLGPALLAALVMLWRDWVVPKPALLTAR